MFHVVRYNKLVRFSVGRRWLRLHHAPNFVHFRHIQVPGMSKIPCRKRPSPMQKHGLHKFSTFFQKNGEKRRKTVKERKRDGRAAGTAPSIIIRKKRRKCPRGRPADAEVFHPYARSGGTRGFVAKTQTTACQHLTTRQADGWKTPQRRWISSAEKNFFVRRGKSFSLRTSSALLRSVFPVPPGTLNLNDLRKQETARGRAVLVPPASAPPHRPRTVRQLRKRSKRSAHTAKRRNFVPVKKAQHDQTPYCTGHEDSRRRHELCRTQ